MRIGQRDAGGERNAKPQHFALDREARLGIEQRRDLSPPARKITSCLGRKSRGLRHADLVGAGKIIDRAFDRAGKILDARPRHHRHQHHIGAFVDVVHQPADQQASGHRIARLAHFPVRRQIERQQHPRACVPRVRPIAVPFASLGGEAQRQHPFPALGRRALGKKLDRDIVVTEPQRGRYRRRGVLGGGRPAEQHTCDERKHACSEVSDRQREGSCVVHG